MRGVHYVINNEGKAEAVLIDLKKLGKLWEDFQDVLISRARRKEPRESLTEVNARLRKNGKIKYCRVSFSLHDQRGGNWNGFQLKRFGEFGVPSTICSTILDQGVPENSLEVSQPSESVSANTVLSRS